jgi:putative endonuclease
VSGDGGRAALGRFAEDLAAAYLEKRGYRIVGRNVRPGSGEIDILAIEGDQTVLVEVRARRGDALGPPQWSLSPAKMRHLRDAAAALLQSRPDLPEEQRIDLVAVSLGRDGRVQGIDLLQSAVEG